MSPVSGSVSTRTPSGSTVVRRDPADEGVVEADPLGAAVDLDRRLGALEDDVLVGQRDPELVAQRLVAEADRQERLPAARAAGAVAARRVTIFGSSPSRGSPGPGPTITRS